MPRLGSKNGNLLADGTPESPNHANVLTDDPPSRNVADLLLEGRSTVGKVLNQSGDSSKDFDKIGEDDPPLDSTSKLGEGLNLFDYMPPNREELKSIDVGHIRADEDKVKNAKPPPPRRKPSASSTPKSVRVDPSSVGANPGTTLGLPAAIGGATSAVPLATGWYLGDAIRAGAQYPVLESAAKWVPGAAALADICANGVRHVRNSRVALGGLEDEQREENDRGLQEAKKGHSASPKAVAEINKHLGTILHAAPDIVTAPMSIAARQARILAVVKNMSPEAAGELAISLNHYASSKAMWARLKSAGVAALGTGAAMTVAGLGIPAGISTAVTGFLTAAAAAGIVKLWHCACQKCFTPHMRLAVDQTEDGESEVRFESREEVKKRLGSLGVRIGNRIEKFFTEDLTSTTARLLLRGGITLTPGAIVGYLTTSVLQLIKAHWLGMNTVGAGFAAFIIVTILMHLKVSALGKAMGAGNKIGKWFFGVKDDKKSDDISPEILATVLKAVKKADTSDEGDKKKQ